LDFATSVLRGFYAFNALVIMACCFVFCARRFLWRHRESLGKRRRGFFPTYTAAGNALQTLQVIAQPRAKYVIEEKFDDEADDDDDGDPCDPTKHLNRQLKKIRRGQVVADAFFVGVLHDPSVELIDALIPIWRGISP
jgi:hypothetical protein